MDRTRPAHRDPEPKRRLRNLIEASDLSEQLVAISPREATDEELLRFQAAVYLERLKRLSGLAAAMLRMGGRGDETPFGPGGYEIARLAAGGALVAIEAILEGRVENAYALCGRPATTRPPTVVVASACLPTQSSRPIKPALMEG